MHVVIALVAPPAVSRGMLRNSLLEIQANLFVGRLNGGQLAELIKRLESDGCVGIAVAASPSAPLGLRIKQLGPMQNRQVVEFDGIQLIKRNQ